MSSSRFCLVYLFLSTIPVFSACRFKDFLVTVKNIENNEFNTTISGCIQATSFNGKVVEELFIRNQTIGNLEKDSVKHLDKLQRLVFAGCELDSISPGAFRNLPEIGSIEITYGNIKDIPRDVFNVLPSLQFLRINNNEIDLIENQAFANLHSLKTIMAYENKLDYWNRDWFANNTILHMINFANNRIRTIPRRAFASSPNLSIIYLGWNEISVIHPDAFLGLTNLQYLGLGYNRLTEIREDSFPNKLKIRTFLIDANYLNFLPDSLLQKISVEFIALSNNPWKCPCLDRIDFWLYRTNATKIVGEDCTGSNIPVCAIPTSYSRTCLETVDPGLTERYIKSLKDITPSLPKDCARLD